METKADGGGWGLEPGPPHSEPLPYTHRLTRGSGLSREAWRSVLTVPLKEGQMVEDPVPWRPVPSPRAGHEGQVSHLFPFLPRGANWALGSGISRKTLGRSEERCESRTVRPRTYPPPRPSPEASVHPSTAPRPPAETQVSLTGSPGSPGAVSPSPGPGGPCEKTAGQGTARDPDPGLLRLPTAHLPAPHGRLCHPGKQTMTP